MHSRTPIGTKGWPDRGRAPLGESARVITHHARHIDPLLIGAGGGGTALNGSTLDPVLQEGPCPILVCSSSDTADRMSWTVRLPARSHGRPLS